MKTAETLYLIDAYGQIFRSYFAIRNEMRSPVTNEPTQAVFGMTAYLLKLLGKLQPDYVIAAIDAPGPTFRDAIHGAYKGTREEIPTGLIEQIPRILQLFDVFGVMRIQQTGLEADDLMAAVTRKVLTSPEHDHVAVRLATKDKDLLQLLCDRVCLYDVQTDAATDVAALFSSRGIRPDQVIDFLTLTGDTVDNVPGVPGIGPKTAAELLQNHDSLDGIYANLSALTARRQAQLADAFDQTQISRTLVTLDSNADLAFHLSETRPQGVDVEAALMLFDELGFHRFKDEILKLPSRGALFANV